MRDGNLLAGKGVGAGRELANGKERFEVNISTADGAMLYEIWSPLIKPSYLIEFLFLLNSSSIYRN